VSHEAHLGPELVIRAGATPADTGSRATSPRRTDSADVDATAASRSAFVPGVRARTGGARAALSTHAADQAHISELLDQLIRRDA
jgi:hypothetical protein